MRVTVVVAALSLFSLPALPQDAARWALEVGQDYRLIPDVTYLVADEYEDELIDPNWTPKVVSAGVGFADEYEDELFDLNFSPRIIPTTVGYADEYEDELIDLDFSPRAIGIRVTSHQWAR